MEQVQATAQKETTTPTDEEKPFNYGEEINKFETSIAMAQHEMAQNREESVWVEAHPKIVEYFNRRGLGNSKHFMYKSVKVCPFGQSEKIQAEMDLPLYIKLHGGQEGIVEGTHSTPGVAIKKLISNA